MGRSGRQEQLIRSRAYAGGMASAASPKRKWPLRKIVDEAMVEIASGAKVRRDVLECGHTIRQASDMIGPTYPASRRCGKCFREQPPDAPLWGRSET